MASVKLGSIASDIRGSIGGTVFSRNGGGAYAKQRVKGTNPNTPGQQLSRSIMSSMIAAWAALTAAVRTDWGVYASNVTVINRLGDAINLSGFNMYCRSRAITEKLGLTFPAAAPTVFTLAEQDPSVACTPDEAVQLLTITFDNTLGWAGEVGGELLVYQGLPQNATVNSYSGPFKYAGKVDGAVVPPTTGVTIASLYAMAEGQKVFCQYRILRADGRLSSPFRTTSICIA